MTIKLKQKALIKTDPYKFNEVMTYYRAVTLP